MQKKLHELIEQLHLNGVSECLDQVLATAENEGLAIQDVLYQLFTPVSTTNHAGVVEPLKKRKNAVDMEHRYVPV